MGRITRANAWAFLQGTLRYKLYYSRLRILIPRHIRKQIAWRIKFMEPECLQRGSCIRCGCRTTALQMASKSCDKPCYPPIMCRKDWEWFMAGGDVRADGHYWRLTVVPGEPGLPGWYTLWRDERSVHERVM